MKEMHGIAASRGIAIGLYQALQIADVKIPYRIVENIQEEYQRFETARLNVIAKLNQVYTENVELLGENAEIFNIHAMMLEDLDYLDSIHNLILQDKCNAEHAVSVTSKKFSEIFSSMEDAYMNQRSADVIDISRQVIDVLMGTEKGLLYGTGEIVVGAEDLLPGHTMQMDKSRILAFITGKGSAVSHAAILAGSLGIPMVAGLGDNLECISDGELLIVDGTQGLVIADPDENTLQDYRSKLLAQQEILCNLQKFKNAQSITLDGRRVELCANIGNPDEIENALLNGAEGIGLMRSEFLYMNASSFPTEEQQFTIYKSMLERMQGKRVVVRTLDFGADKHVDYFELPKEANPALGYRAIRICLSQKDIFGPQIRALLRASVYGKLAIMFPMVISVDEVHEIKAFVQEQKQQLIEAGIAVSDSLELGVMIETPAAALISDQLAQEVDFFSIGTNDLTQYTLAVDRMNEKIGHLFNTSHPAVLQLINLTIQNAHKNGIWVGICGEAAADTSLTPHFLSMGIDELSVSVPSILPVREVVCKLDLSQFQG